MVEMLGVDDESVGFSSIFYDRMMYVYTGKGDEIVKDVIVKIS